MKVNNISYKDTGFYSKLILDFLDKEEKLHPFVDLFFEKENIIKAIEKRASLNFVSRDVLADALAKQYDSAEISEATAANIELLRKDNTFTLTTAHQLNLYMGPMYYVLKILHCIKLCKELSEQYPSYNFVPIFWMNTEDHDFEEVNHFNMFGKKLEWETDQKGAVGLFENRDQNAVIEKLDELFGDTENANYLLNNIKKHFTKEKKYGPAMFSFVNSFFSRFGLVIYNQHNDALKKTILPFFKDELTNHNLYRTVLEHSKKLEEAGYHQQALPRAINLFYIDDTKGRNRIIYKEEKYFVNDTNIVFTEAEILKELETNTVRFSTNVLSRPIYQQSILPNLAYIGGGGELAYWMQLKASLDHFNVFFPILILRKSIMWVDKNLSKKMGKLGLNESHFFNSSDSIIKDFVKLNTTETLTLEKEKIAIKKIFETIKTKAKSIDPTLEKSADGELTKQIKSIENLESKILRAEKRKFEQSNTQITNIKSKLFPSGKLQERHDNFMIWYNNYGTEFFDILYEHLETENRFFSVYVED